MGGFLSYPELHSGVVPPRARSFRNGPDAGEVLHLPGFPNAAAGQLNPQTRRPMVRR